ncbi:hypothetical protein MUP46_00805 [Patescibacteria group bacterium]|nr:hypothetical protein [Patescibacteria group bacterium]
MAKRELKFNESTFNEEYILNLIRREIGMGRIVEVFKGYDAFGRFDGSYTINSYSNPDYIKRQKI